MDWTALERSRTILRRRVKRAAQCPDVLFGSECHQLLTWLRAHPVFGTELALIGSPTEDILQMIREIDNSLGAPKEIRVHRRVPDVERVRIALYLAVLDACARHRTGEQSDEAGRRKYLARLLVGQEDPTLYLPIARIREVALDGVAMYLEERLELGYGLLEATLRYKQRCEFFHRARLQGIAEGGKDGFNGERVLARDLYEYVFDRNLEFTIEENTGAGWPDLVLRTPSGGYGVLDAKYLKTDEPSAFKNSLAGGFHQVARYCTTKNESWGVLAAYLNTQRYPVLELENVDGLSFLTVNSIRVYFVIIDIFNRPSGSKSGVAEQVEIRREDLLKEPNSSSAQET